jgi:hypothetical protein
VILLNDDIANSPLLNRVKLCAGFPDWRCSRFISRENLSLGQKAGLKTRERIPPDV